MPLSLSLFVCICVFLKSAMFLHPHTLLLLRDNRANGEAQQHMDFLHWRSRIPSRYSANRSHGDLYTRRHTRTQTHAHTHTQTHARTQTRACLAPNPRVCAPAIVTPPMHCAPLRLLFLPQGQYGMSFDKRQLYETGNTRMCPLPCIVII